MENRKPNPGRILEMSGAYWKTCTLHAGVKLDVFTAIDNGCQKPDDLADELQADREALFRLLNALSALGFLNKNKDVYENTEEAALFLSRNSDSYKGHMIMHHHHLVESWSRLDKAVMTGEPVRTRPSLEDETVRESFLMGMFNNAMIYAPEIAEIIDLAGKKRLLDLGGGPGTYAVHFCKKYPDLQAVVYDLPTTRPYAEKVIGRFGLSDRIEFMAGDYTSEELKGGYDAVWLSHILHGESPQTCERLVEKAVSVLNPGGLIVIHEFILDDTLDHPVFPALFSLNMLLGTSGGKAYSESELTRMLSGAGAKNIRRLPYRSPTDSGLISGEV